eukprot:CAMPEP_0168537842 /NCGR_PEP_ID=MMETSP0405-20121227/20661_1 /TAXON_ID=498012 /ORGANISM="Trichosphaerium sp, Strain Am-I-7 wt" /LENGTH=176 /DNA_ID=CAMNT_0008566667 /DNA_START=212 /DNA_END=738 /DNA_ORIENTATION=-
MALAVLFDKYNWVAWRFKCVPMNYWDDLLKQRALFDDLGSSMGVKLMTDWYNITNDDIVKYRGSGLTKNRYIGLNDALRTIYPEYNWSFKNSPALRYPKGYFAQKDNQIDFIRNLSTHFDIQDPYAWQRVSRLELKELAGSGIFKYFPDMLRLFGYTWEWSRSPFNSCLKAKQRSL